MKRALPHLFNELRLMLYLKRRYWYETVLGLVFLLGLGAALVYAVVTVGGKPLDSGALDTLIVGAVLWHFAAASYASASNDIAEETRQRTVEQLYIVPLSLARLLGLRALLHLLASAMTLCVAVAALQWLLDGRLQSDLGPLLAAALLAAPSLAGVGYAVAGVLLLAKRAELTHGLMYFALVSLVALPAFPANGFALLPYALGAAAAKAAAGGAVIDGFTYALIAANSAAWLAAGVLLFRTLERRARRLGVLGHW
ncbi:hypothetical protein [Roseateles asaccharophilus]|uniref:ABC-2 type transport system permease protein n=1 Tax=Roseateles asaccharophilus TaxID=582607 RepID=A0ABU2A749_9BURK|nr:hypothetical protein [Roseateles asaccharophilus]MDR7333021.1 ABC-2 type transport system permease protein [Roseateles asaccharophilus]